MKAIYGFATRRPVAVLALVGLATAAAVPFLLGLRLDSRTENLLPRQSDGVQEYERFREAYGSDEVILVAYRPPDGRRVVDREAFATLTELTERIAAIAEVESDGVISISNARVPSLVPGPGGLTVAALPFSPPPVDEAGSAALAARIAEFPLLEGMLVSEDLRTAAVVVLLAPAPTAEASQSHQIAATREIEAIVAEVEARDGGEFHVAGAPVTKSVIVTLLAENLAVLIPVAATAITLILFGLFRSIRGIVVPLATVGLSIVWTLGILGATGHSINMVTSLLPPLLLAVGCADSIHILMAWLLAPDGSTPADPVRTALDETATPCLLTTVTTMGGFLSLGISPIRPIAEFGLFAAVGCLLALVLSLTLVPALLTLFPRRAGARPPRGGASMLDRMAVAIGRLSVGRPRLVLASHVLLMVAFLAVAWHGLEVEVDFLGDLDRDHPHSRAVRFVSAELAGPAPLEIVVEASPGAFRDPEELLLLATFQERLEDLVIVDRHGQPLDAIDRTVSVADFVQAAHRLEGGTYSIPTDRRRIERYRFLASLAAADEPGLDRLLSADHSEARVSGRMRHIGSSESTLLVAAIEREFEAVYGSGDGHRLRVTGAAITFLETGEAITRGQAESFALALVFVSLSILVLFRSLRAMAISLVPNLFPIAFLFGFMAATGIALDIATAMVASIAISIAVDDTTHFLTMFRRRVVDHPPAEAAVDTCRRIGAAISTTTIVLCVGFGVSLLSSFNPTRHFGLLGAVTIAAALHGDLVILPALVALYWKDGRPAQASS